MVTVGVPSCCRLAFLWELSQGSATPGLHAVSCSPPSALVMPPARALVWLPVVPISCAFVESTRVMFHHVNYCLPMEVIRRFLGSGDPFEGAVDSTLFGLQERWSVKLREDPEFSAVWRLAVPRNLGAVALQSKL